MKYPLSAAATALCLWVSLTTAAAAELPAVSKPGVLGDLLSVITISGGYCGRVTTASSSSLGHYRVTCSSGGLFRIDVSEDEKIRVIDERVGNVEWQPENEGHPDHIRRRLFALINLTYQSCDQLVNVEGGAESDYQVACKNSNAFSIKRGKDGRLLIRPMAQN